MMESSDLNLPEKRVITVPAQLWKRLLAFLFDLFILDFFVISPFTAVVQKLIPVQKISSTYLFLQNNPTDANILFMLMIIVSVFLFSYFVLSEFMTGQTIGCMLFGLKVVSYGPDNKPLPDVPGFGSCILRNLFLIPIIPLVILLLVEPLFYLFVGKNQRFTEWLTKTGVVEEKIY